MLCCGTVFPYKNLRTHFIQKTAETWEIHKDLQRAIEKNKYIENEIKKNFWEISFVGT